MKDTGGPAFPSKKRVVRAGYATEEFEPVNGMTLLDWYAGQALIGILARPAVDYRTTDELARQAHAVARAMIQERSRT